MSAPLPRPALAGRAASVPLATLRKSPSRHSRPAFERGRFRSERGADLTPAQVAFGQALQAWKLKHRCPFPTYSQVLDVVVALGYRCVAPAVEI